jgi:phospholipase/lecithinase/hemolysin
LRDFLGVGLDDAGPPDHSTISRTRRLIDSGGVASADARYIIEMGGNDVRDALATFAAGGNGGIIIQQALSSIAGAVQVLYGAGARRFLIRSAPNVAVTPAIRVLDGLSPGAVAFALQLTQVFNTALNGVVAQLEGLPDIQIKRLDAFRLVNDIVSDPAQFGLTNVTDACISPTAHRLPAIGPMTFCSGTASIRREPYTRSSRAKRSSC